MNGQGTEFYASGDRYEGSWKDGSYNGQGTLYLNNGKVLERGVWSNGVFQG